MASTRAVPAAVLEAGNRSSVAGQPLCPACKVGYLQPYKVWIGLSSGGEPWEGVKALSGWVAVCEGNARHNEKMRELYALAERVPAEDDLVDVVGCGFTMPMQALWPDAKVVWKGTELVPR